MACGDISHSLPADGMPSERATTTAQPVAQSFSSTPVGFISEKTGQYRDFSRGGHAVSSDRWVWAVDFSGTFHQSGGPANSSPLPDHHSVLVIIDYRTGQFIEASIPSPGQPD
jgi:hypothetical protein